MSDGAYDIPAGIFSGFPLISDGAGNVEIVIRDYAPSDSRTKLVSRKTANELLEEKNLRLKDLI